MFLATFRKQSSYTLFTLHSKVETVSPRGEKNRVVASLRSFSRAARARQRVLYARVKEWQALGGNIWPHTRRSRVELEAKWHSKRRRKNIKRFHAFELSREADDAEDRFGGGEGFVARPSFLSFRAPVLLFPSRTARDA